MYSTGEYVKPEDPVESRFSHQQWSLTTEEIMQSILKTTPCGWKEIIKASIPYIGTHKSRPTSRAVLNEQREGPNGYLACYDRYEGSDSGSDFTF
jgi:hypothetical protein